MVSPYSLLHSISSCSLAALFQNNLRNKSSPEIASYWSIFLSLWDVNCAKNVSKILLSFFDNPSLKAWLLNDILFCCKTSPWTYVSQSWSWGISFNLNLLQSFMSALWFLPIRSAPSSANNHLSISSDQTLHPTLSLHSKTQTDIPGFLSTKVNAAANQAKPQPITTTSYFSKASFIPKADYINSSNENKLIIMG